MCITAQLTAKLPADSYYVTGVNAVDRLPDPPYMSDRDASFVQLVPTLRQRGLVALEVYRQSVLVELRQYWQECNSLVGIADPHTLAMKGLEKIVYQLGRLAKVWSRFAS